MPLDYALAEEQYRCSDKGISPLLDEDSCHSAAQFVKSNGYPNIPVPVRPTSKASSPKGCFVLYQGDSNPQNGVWFNHHQTGSTQQHSRQICQGLGTLTTSMFFQ